MDLQSIFAYGLIFIFFIVLFILSTLILVPMQEAPQGTLQAETSKEGPLPQTSKLAYGLVAAIFVFFAVLTFISHRRNLP